MVPLSGVLEGDLKGMAPIGRVKWGEGGEANRRIPEQAGVAGVGRECPDGGASSAWVS